ncbi:MAG: hypothetical protein HZA59_07505 [Hydrogenophilales bacterium]|nr:hypothetical protein [Hydrogenophilales bacterium]
MNDRIRQILNQITSLEDELKSVLHEQESRMRYQIKDKRIEFERSIEAAHQQLKVGLVQWFLHVRPINYLTAPIIYGLIVPLMFVDVCVTLYQAMCFPIYGILKAKRANYIVMDHRHLAYLNIFEKAHCMYCAYASGVLALAVEVTSRTEQYFCPIKHARKILGSTSRYAHYLGYGEAEDFHNKLEQFRDELAEELRQAKGKEDAVKCRF